MLQNFRRDTLPWGQQGNTGGIAHNKLAAYPPPSFLQGEAVLLCVERLLGAGYHFRFHIFLIQKACWIPLVAPPDLRQSADQSLYLLGAVPHGEVSQDIADVAELNLNVIFIPQNVVHLDASQTDVQGMDAELGGIEIKD